MKRIDLSEVTEAAPAESFRQEALFLGFLAAAAWLGSESPFFEYPQGLWVLLALLTANSILHRMHGRWPGPTALVSLALNTLLVAHLVDASGGAASTLWPLFLLATFTAGMSLPGWTLRAAGLQTALLLCFYLEPLRDGDPAAAAELAFKTGFLFFSAWTVGRLGGRERQARKRLQQRQAALDALSLLQVDSVRFLAGTRGSILDSLQGLNDRLGVILGSAQLLLEATPHDSPEARDAVRITRAASECGQLTRRILLAADLMDRYGAQAATHETETEVPA